MAAALLTGVLSVSLTVPSAQLTSRPLAHAASCHTLRSVHHGIRMEEDGEDEASFERAYQQNVESGATTTVPLVASEPSLVKYALSTTSGGPLLLTIFAANDAASASLDGPATPAASGKMRRRMTMRGAAGELPSIIIEVDENVEALVSELRRVGPDDEMNTVRAVMALGEIALPVLVRDFPGPLWFDRHRPHRRLPRGRDVSAIARTLAPRAARAQSGHGVRRARGGGARGGARQPRGDDVGRL